jgi:hypothetical protein
LVSKLVWSRRQKVDIMGRLATADWNVTTGSGLTGYLRQIQRFPMLEPREERMLAAGASTATRRRRTSSSTAIYASSLRSPGAIAAMACQSLMSSRRAMSA